MKSGNLPILSIMKSIVRLTYQLHIQSMMWRVLASFYGQKRVTKIASTFFYYSLLGIFEHFIFTWVTFFKKVNGLGIFLNLLVIKKTAINKWGQAPTIWILTF